MDSEYLYPGKVIVDGLGISVIVSVDEKGIATAQTLLPKSAFIEAYNKYIKDYEERPQGECKSCRHRDPEDKKCDCGALERQDCPFPVSDDYYCKYYEGGSTD